MMKYITLFVLFSLSFVFAQDKLKIGVLSYGTVNWELNVLKHHNLDKKYGFDLELVNIASKNAQSVALLANEVDMIVHDWVWINLQKNKNKNFMFYPYSKATGTLVVDGDSDFKSLLDLRGKDIGIAGGKYSKTWLLFKAYYEKKYKRNLEKDTSAVYASPSILYLKMLNHSLLASINFWHFNAKLQAKGIKALISIKEVLHELEIESDIPFIGWTFTKKFADKNKKLINSFITATHEAKTILQTNDKEWNRIKDIMNVKDKKTFESLKQGYKNGVIKELSDSSIKDMKKVYSILAKQSGFKYVDKNSMLSDDIFWKFEKEK